MITPDHADQLDLLVGRIADGEAASQDWDAFNALAAHSPAAWKDLAQAQRQRQALTMAVGVALHAADRVDLPSRENAHAFPRSRSHRPGNIVGRIRQAGGWAVAAVLALALIGGARGPFTFLSPNQPGPNTAGIGAIPANYFPVNSSDDALQLYRDQGRKDGRFIAEVPVLLESRPAATGRGFEVVYVRQILERAEVDNLLRFAQDEAGRAIPVRMTVPGRAGQTE